MSGVVEVWVCVHCGRLYSDKTERAHADCFVALFEAEMAALVEQLASVQ